MHPKFARIVHIHNKKVLYRCTMAALNPYQIKESDILGDDIDSSDDEVSDSDMEGDGDGVKQKREKRERQLKRKRLE